MSTEATTATIGSDAAYQALCDPDRLMAAFAHVESAGGAPGVDGVRVSAFAEDLLPRVKTLAERVESGRYLTSPLLAVRMPKDRDPRGRELLIPTVEDRLLQRAVHDALSPVADGLLLPCVHGFRSGHSVQRAVEACRSAVVRRPWVVDADIRDFFASVPFETTLDALRAVAPDPRLLEIAEQWLSAPALRAGRQDPREAGLPLGSPLSPLLANLVLRPLDAALFSERVTYVRFADDLVVCCEGQAEATAAMEACGQALEPLGLALHAGKSRVVDTRSESLVFLGHLVRSDGSDGGGPQLERPFRRTLHIVEPGAQLSTRGGRLILRRDGVELLSVPVRRVRDIVVLAPIGVTSGAMTVCLEHGIDVSWMSGHGRCWGALRTWRSRAPELRRLQAELMLDEPRRLAFARILVEAKVRNQRRLLQRRRSRDADSGLDLALRELDAGLKRIRRRGGHLVAHGR